MKELEQTARMIFEAETGRAWKDATGDERAHWLMEAQRLHDAIHGGVWPTLLNSGSIH